MIIVFKIMITVSVCSKKIFANMKIRLDHSILYSYSSFFLKTFYDNYEYSGAMCRPKKI